MVDSTVRRLRLLAATLAVGVATVHLLHPTQGGQALLVYASAGFLGDPRPVLFTAGGFALIFGVLLGYNGFAGRALYAGGAVVALAFLVGYGLWHTVLDHGAFWPHIEGSHHHGTHPVVVVLEHLRGDVLALVSTLLELGLLATLLALIRVDSGQ